MFGRRRKQEDPDAQPAPDGEFVDDLDEQDRVAEDAQLHSELDRESSQAPRVSPPRGPWDAGDSGDADQSVSRLDLGGLLVPIPDDTEVRVDLTPEGEVVAATLVRADSTMQVGAFAAPRTEGIWSEVREEIRASLRDSGGSTQEGDGPFGPELRAAVPTEAAGQGVVLAPARFLGVDGPRWFLRALLTGPAALDDEVAAPFEQAFREVVVVRGTEPMAVRDPLPLRLPPEAQQVDEPDEPDGTQRPEPGMPERGPEITETR